MNIILSPTDLVRLVLEQFFGRASIVVFMWLLITAVLAWIAFGRQVTRAKTFAKTLHGIIHDDFGRRSLKTKETVRLAIHWTIFYGIASFVTQIWAGSRFSPGQGNGLVELAAWSILFGVLAVAFTFALLPSAFPVEVVHGVFVGFIIGALYAVVTFTMADGPKPGDWWVAPAASCCVTMVLASRGRFKQAARSADVTPRT